MPRASPLFTFHKTCQWAPHQCSIPRPTDAQYPEGQYPTDPRAQPDDAALKEEGCVMGWRCGIIKYPPKGTILCCLALTNATKKAL